MFWNLLNNAVKFSEPGGRIIVRTSSDNPEMIRIAIRDFGAGMDAGTLEGLFRPFEQRPERAGRRGGLGLGLTISTGIIEGHHGQIWARSDGVGLGSTIEIELATCDPVAAVEPRAAPRRQGTGVPQAPESRREVEGAFQLTPPPSANGTGRSVLVVEDHHDTATLLSMFLSQHGFDVTVTQSLTDALNLLDREWAVVLSDIGLVDGSGLDIARRAKSLQIRPGRMIALSGFGSAADIAASHDAGFDEHLVKPIDLEKLLEAIAGTKVI